MICLICLLVVSLCVTCASLDNCNILTRENSPDHFHCIVLNWRSMQCWFDLTTVYNKRNYYTAPDNIDIVVNAGIVGMTSPVPRNNLKKNNTTLEIRIPHVSLAVNEVLLNITCKETNWSDINCFEIHPIDFVKPNKIDNVLLAESATSIRLSWRHSNTQMSKVFRVQYSSEYDYEWKFENTKSYGLSVNNLWPYTNYYFKIDVKPLNSSGSETGFWSESLEISSRTKQDVPSGVPEFWPGYFSQRADSNKVKLYWKPISLEKRCGIITNYRIIMKEEKISGKWDTSQLIEDIPGDAISREILTTPQRKYQIKLSQRTKIGYPKIADSQIYIYPSHMRPKLSSNFVVEAINLSSVFITWEPAYLEGTESNLKEVLSYLIVWCTLASKTPGDCLDVLNAKLIPYERTTNTILISPIKGHYSNYHFGISVDAVSREGWVISSGITWYQGCIYLQEGVPEVPLVLVLPPYVDHDNGLYLEWTNYTCNESVGKVISYILNYCEVRKGETKCQANERNITISRMKTSYTLTGLTREKRYLLKLATKIKNGKLGPWSNTEKVLFQPMKRIRNDKSNLTLVIILGVGIGLTCLLITIFGVRYLISYSKRHCEEVQADDEVTVNYIKKCKKSGHDGSGDVHLTDHPLLD